jgi:hypothetical protein
MTAKDELVAWLTGYIDALASVNGIANQHPVFSASAFVIKDGNEDINAVLSNYFRGRCSSLRKDFTDLDVVDYQFESAEVHFAWVRWLHQELEQRLLPAPCVISQESNSTMLYKTRYHVAWQVMETLRMVTEDFQTPQIYRARYTREEYSHGYAYAIPLKDAYLVLSFQASGKPL